MQRFLGLDVTRTYVRAALLNVSLRKITVEALEEVSVEDAGSVKDALWAAVGDVKPDGTAVQLSGEKAFFRRIELPAAATKEIQSVLGYELESTVPFEMEEAVFDHRMLKPAEGSETVPVFAAVARIEDVRERIELVKDALKIDPERVGVGAMPLSNLTQVIPELEGVAKKGEPADDKPVAILSLGERTSDIVILQAGEPVFARSLSRGTYGLPGSAPALSRELRQTLAAWRAQGGDLLHGIYLVGGGASAAGAEVFLSTELGVSILPLPEPKLEGLTPEQRDKLPRFSMAIGLALGLTRSKAFDLRRGALEVERRYPFLRDRVPLLAGLGAAIAVSFVFSVLSQNRSLDSERELLDARLAVVSQEVLGESTTDPQKARDLLSSGPGAEDDPLPQADAFDVMVKLSEAVPKEVAHDVLELDYARNNHVTIQATVPSVADAQNIAEKMKEHRCFKDVKVSRTIQYSADRQKYTLEFDVKCEKEKKKPKDKPADADESPSASATAKPEKESGK